MPSAEIPERPGNGMRVAPKNNLKIVPVIKSSDLQRSLHFYTAVLDFGRKRPGHEDREMANGVADLVREGPNCTFQFRPSLRIR